MKLLAKILLCLSVALLFTHQLIPHDHDEHSELPKHPPIQKDHDHFASHNVDHLFNNSFQKIILKVAVHYIECAEPSTLETPFIIQYTLCKRRYKDIRPPLITYSYHFSLRAPPNSI